MPTPKYRNIGIIDAKFGRNCEVVKPVNLYGCTIGDDCFIGPFVEIQKNVSNWKPLSHSITFFFLCELVYHWR